jgi:hypothetical protein
MLRQIGMTVLGIVLTTALAAQEPVPRNTAQPVLTVEEVIIEPSIPAADTLCKLRVKLYNGGEGPSTALGFRVAVGGTDLPVYQKQLFMDTIPPGASTEVQLFNFWTTESRRPTLPDGKLNVLVELREAHWVETTTEDDGTEVQTMGDIVPGLPSSKQLLVALNTSETKGSD